MGRFLWSAAIWCLVGYALYTAFSLYQGNRGAAVPQTLARMVEPFTAAASGARGDACQSTYPTSGALTYINPALESLPRNATVTITNQTNQAKHLVFRVPGGGSDQFTIFVDGQSHVTQKVPFGSYSLMVTSPGTWCNNVVGFLNTRRVQYTTPLSLEPDLTTSLHFTYNSDESKPHFALSVSTSENDERMNVMESGHGINLRLQRARDGHFYVSGHVNGFPVVFMIDTGATEVALPSWMARNAGVKHCKRMVFRTANGRVDGCMGRVSYLQVGPYQFNNVTVGVSPNLDVPLIGQNILGRLSMVTSDNLLELRPRP